MDELIGDFLTEAEAHLAAIDADLARLPAEGAQGAALLRVVRALHTIKGTCGFLKLRRTEALAHACEGALVRWRDGRAQNETLVLVQTGLAQIRAILASVAATGAEPDDDDVTLLGALGAMPNALDWALELAAIRDRLLSQAGAVLNATLPRPAPLVARDAPALAPISSAWSTLPLLVEELAHKLGKSVRLLIEGEDVEAPGVAIAPVRNALVHLVRNCADHGIETPADRRDRGKPEMGVLRLSATRQEGAIVVRLADDGRGLNTDLIRNRAIARGLVFASQAARMSAEQIHAFIFAPGFSTADALTTLSGRGIGLDVVRAAIEGLGGAVTLQSEAGHGTVFILTIPDNAAEIVTAEPASPAAVVADVA